MCTCEGESVYDTIDNYKIHITINLEDREIEADLDTKLTLAELQDMIGEIMEANKPASSFIFTVVRVSHTQDHEFN